MSLFVPLKRATLLIPSGAENDKDRKHLFVLLTDPHDDGTGTKCVLLVSLSTVKQNLPHDRTCILYQGDHPFIKRESYVVYQRARIEEVAKILRGVKSGQLIAQATMDGAIFARICKGIEESRLTPPKSLNFYRMATGYF